MIKKVKKKTDKEKQTKNTKQKNKQQQQQQKNRKQTEKNETKPKQKNKIPKERETWKHIIRKWNKMILIFGSDPLNSSFVLISFAFLFFIC